MMQELANQVRAFLTEQAERDEVRGQAMGDRLVRLHEIIATEKRDRRRQQRWIWFAVILAVVAAGFFFVGAANARAQETARNRAVADAGRAADARAAAMAATTKVVVRCAIIEARSDDHALYIAFLSEQVVNPEGEAFIAKLKERYAAADADFAAKLDVDCPG